MTSPGPASRRGNASTPVLVLLFLAAGLVLIPMAFGAKGLRYFAETPYARGVITFSISIATIAIAFVLVYQAFASEAKTDDEGFRRGREVFTGLMGVLGTIVGFYFGAADGTGARLALAALRLDHQTVTTFVSGGVPPYRFTVAVGKKKSEQKVSADGWIVDTLAEAPAPGETIMVEVVDGRNLSGSQSVELPKQAAPPATAPQTPPSPDSAKRK
jgi:hypothetical protein